MIDLSLLVVAIAVLATLSVSLSPRRGWWGRLPRARQAALMTLAIAPAVLWAGWLISRSRSFQFFGDIVSRVRTRERAVALTFDDGPTPVYAPRILALLREQGVRATFFVTGRELQDHPELGGAIVTGGHELGNHTYSHARMVGVSPAFVRDEIERTDALIRATGYQGPIHVRSPYCKKLFVFPWVLARAGRKNITFDVEPDSDPVVAADAAKITAHVLARARPGSIILIHAMYPSGGPGLAALPGVVEGLKERSYRFVTVSELLAAGDGERE
jgi:peptidoglycan/xylan/chitin deacetylase (PgdA/CDA1 family)